MGNFYIGISYIFIIDISIFEKKFISVFRTIQKFFWLQNTKKYSKSINNFMDNSFISCPFIEILLMMTILLCESLISHLYNQNINITNIV